MSFRHVCFSHGQESGPWGTKIRAMAEVVRARGWEVESLDYQGMADPRERADKLVAHCQGLAGPPVLVGSSMGGFVSLSAAARVPVRAMFLLAPAFYLPPLEEYLPDLAAVAGYPTVIVHGWHDDVVPFAGSVRYGTRTGARVLLVDGDHRLTANIDLICRELTAFLTELDEEGQ